MGILSWILVGLVAGLLAKAIVPGNQDIGIIMTIVLGIVGGLVGGWIASLIFGAGVSGFNLWTLLIATVGAIVVLWIYIAAKRR
ncbi:MAG: GlsB/YeaQ/YmgE family stress response membrane protein [Coriobacteriia bacterium]